MISTKTARLYRNRREASSVRRNWKWLAVAGCLAVGLAIAGVVLLANQQPSEAEAPEAGKVLDVQAQMPFQVLIPAYLPRPFNRAKAEISVDQTGPGGEPMVQIAYRTRDETTLFVRQWVPVNPDKEILAGSRPIQTKWGRGLLLTQGGEGMIALWLDIGPLRVSVYTENTRLVSREQLLNIGETMGPASNIQVFSFSLEQPHIKDMAPPPPFEVKVNDAGIQEFTLVVTPGGYSPTRFVVRKGIPARMTFRALGNVGSGMTLIFATNSTTSEALTLKSLDDKQVFEFTPSEAGSFEFFCSHRMYRGIMTVVE